MPLLPFGCFYGMTPEVQSEAFFYERGIRFLKDELGDSENSNGQSRASSQGVSRRGLGAGLRGSSTSRGSGGAARGSIGVVDDEVGGVLDRVGVDTESIRARGDGSVVVLAGDDQVSRGVGGRGAVDGSEVGDVLDVSGGAVDDIDLDGLGGSAHRGTVASPANVLGETGGPDGALSGVAIYFVESRQRRTWGWLV